MSYTRQLLVENSDISKIAIGILVAIMLFGLFVSGFDQGQLFSLVEGKQAFDNKWLHEFVHDMRHASGFHFFSLLLFLALQQAQFWD
jgi:hypothetical protein